MNSEKSELTTAQIRARRIWIAFGAIIVLAFALRFWRASVLRADHARATAALPQARELLHSDKRFHEVEVEITYLDTYCLLFSGHVYDEPDEQLLQQRLNSELGEVETRVSLFYRVDHARVLGSQPASSPLR